jgi:hypothetical protein
MKLLILLAYLVHLTSTQFSYAYECTANVRDRNHNLIKQRVQLDHLVSDTAYKGKYFEVVHSKDETPVNFNHETLDLRACTVYYHLSKARNYFQTHFNDRYLSTLRELKIRIDMPYSFIDSSHYMHEDFKSDNNSITIPPSTNARVPEVDAWGYEIWFAPAKKAKKSNQVEMAASIVNSATSQNSLRLGVATSLGQTMAADLARGVTITSLEGQMYVESLLLSLFVVTATPFIIEKSAAIFKRTFYLDTALLPEVIYHEFAHVALSKFLRPSHKSPINEGMANFFAADIGNTSKILSKTNGLAKGLNPLNANKKIKFEPWMEDKKYAQFGFTFHLLWKIKRELGDSFSRELIYETHKKLNASSKVRQDLLAALESTVKELIVDANEEKIILLKLAVIWQELGLSVSF